MGYRTNWAVVVPMANEEKEFALFIDALTSVLDRLGSGAVYIVVDRVSLDSTKEMSIALSASDPRYNTVWAPENRHVIDAYLRGFKEAYDNGHDIIIEMDAGMSHDPQAIPLFIKALDEGYSCAFGSRFIAGGSIAESPLFRRVLSRYGTLLANLLLGTGMSDMTSGYQGFRADVVAKLLQYDFLSTAHFYQTEVRYLLRGHCFTEVPIHYRAPSPRISRDSILNSLKVLVHYVIRRITGKAAIIC